MRSPRVLIAEFASLTTPYCWVITEDAVAGYDGARAASSRQVRPWLGPGQAAAEDVAEALTAGRFFRLVDGKGRELAIGRLYDPSGESELAPVDEFGRQILGAPNIEFRAGGDWQAARLAWPNGQHSSTISCPLLRGAGICKPSAQPAFVPAQHLPPLTETIR
ncbi:MAG: hypothetical protein WA895_28205 [Streptosporangiaceae bacterium]